MIDVDEFRLHVIRPVIQQLGMWSQAAENLLVGTAVQESGLRHLRQLNDGPARGLFQIEPATHDDVWENFLEYQDELRVKAAVLLAPAPPQIDQLVTNLGYACAIARLIYYRRPEPLPGADDIEGLAHYWKRHFNTEAGAGTVPEFILNYREHVKRNSGSSTASKSGRLGWA